MSFNVAVTIMDKRDSIIPIWNKTHLSLPGDKTELKNLMTQLEVVKQDVNQAVNRLGISLKNVNVNIDIL
jgi:hypothetical protein